MRLPFVPKPKIERGGTQLCMHIASDRYISEPKLDMRGHFLVDEEARMAWGLSGDLIKEWGTGELVQIITDRSCAPVHIERVDDPWAPDDIERVIEEYYDAEMSRIEREGKRNFMINAVTLIALVFAILVSVLIVGGLIQSGALDVKF